MRAKFTGPALDSAELSEAIEEYRGQPRMVLDAVVGEMAEYHADGGVEAACPKCGCTDFLERWWLPSSADTILTVRGGKVVAASYYGSSEVGWDGGRDSTVHCGECGQQIDVDDVTDGELS